MSLFGSNPTSGFGGGQQTLTPNGPSGPGVMSNNPQLQHLDQYDSEVLLPPQIQESISQIKFAPTMAT